MTMTPATLPSRIKGPQKILKQLRTLKDRAWQVRVRNDRAVLRVGDQPDAAQWCARVGDGIDRAVLPTLDRLIAEGDAVLPHNRDPRDQRRVRKSRKG
jgi:hypothetical protein